MPCWRLLLHPVQAAIFKRQLAAAMAACVTLPLAMCRQQCIAAIWASGLPLLLLLL